MLSIQGYTYDRVVTGNFVHNADRTWTGHRLKTDRDRRGRQVMVTAGTIPGKDVLDTSWLKAASEVYDISPNIQDYVFAEVPGCQADLPNRNLDNFPYQELTKFRPILGQLTYKSFIGKLTSHNHCNQDPKQARGVIFDASMQKINGYWYVKTLTGWCLQKDPKLAKRILKNKDEGYSMACLIEAARCSVCGYLAKGNITCRHVNGGTGKGSLWNGDQLVYEDMININFWEMSHVDDRADFDAVHDWSAA